MPPPDANARLMEAAAAGDIGGIRAALADGADELDRALKIAAPNGRTLAANYLLDSGAGEKQAMRLALMEALRFGQPETARLLLDRGAQLITQRNDPGSLTSLSGAVETGNVETARLALEYGADIQTDGRDAFRRAIRYGRPEMARLLIEQGLNSWEREARSVRRNPLIYALHPKKNKETLSFLETIGYKESNFEIFLQGISPITIVFYALSFPIFLPSFFIFIFTGIILSLPFFWAADRYAINEDMLFSVHIAIFVIINLIFYAFLFSSMKISGTFLSTYISCAFLGFLFLAWDD